ncbi:MAG: aspartate carbamoyltransferase catalytic subunit [Acidimicrobiales bacterium]
MTGLRTRHLLGIADLDRADLVELLQLSSRFAEVAARPIPRVPALRGKTVATVFFENSTRTRLSFEAAAKRLSAETMSFAVGTSSVQKGESLRDTVETIDAMGIDAMVIRHHSVGAPHRVAEWIDAAVINAGDGAHEHPTQALADCYTLLDALGEGRLSRGDLSEMSIAFVGDIRHSRVARSSTLAFQSLGAQVTFVAPTTLLPPSLAGFGVEVAHELDPIIGDLDVVYVLRLQTERMTGSYIPSLREYATRYGLNVERARKMRKGAFVMHPGPMNRDVEIDAEVASSESALVTRQVTSGVAVRMAVLFALLASPGAVDAAAPVADEVPDVEENSRTGRRSA